jgi:hypothetical protein
MVKIHSQANHNIKGGKEAKKSPEIINDRPFQTGRTFIAIRKNPTQPPSNLRST